MTALDQLMGEMIASGAIVDTGGLMPIAMGARLHLTNGKVTVTDGPFIEAKELVGGYCIVRTDTKDEAVELARRFLDAHATHGYEGESEIRQLMGAEDFVGEGISPQESAAAHSKTGAFPKLAN